LRTLAFDAYQLTLDAYLAQERGANAKNTSRYKMLRLQLHCQPTPVVAGMVAAVCRLLPPEVGRGVQRTLAFQPTEHGPALCCPIATAEFPIARAA
jgi:hypothetical protein